MARRHGVQTCDLRMRRAALSGAFGLDLAMRWFGMTESQAAETYGRYRSGPRRGLIRGYVVWCEVIEGGWSYALQTVLRPGMKVGYHLSNAEADRVMMAPASDAIRNMPSVPVRTTTT